MTQNKLLDTRKEMGLTQAEMAKLLGLSKSGYGKIERGERNGKLDTYRQISEKINKSISDLII